MEIDLLHNNIESEIESIKPYLNNISISNIVWFQKSSGSDKEIGYRLGFVSDVSKTIIMNRYGRIFTVFNYLVHELEFSPIMVVLKKLEMLREKDKIAFHEIDLNKF